MPRNCKNHLSFLALVIILKLYINKINNIDAGLENKA